MRISDILPTSMHQKVMLGLEHATLTGKSTMGQITYSVAAIVTGVFSAFEKTVEVPLRVVPTLTVSLIRPFKKDEFYPSLTLTNLLKTAEAVFHQGRGVLLTLISPLFGCAMNFEAQRMMGNYTSERKAAAEIHTAAEEASQKAVEAQTKAGEAKTVADEVKVKVEAVDARIPGFEAKANEAKVAAEEAKVAAANAQAGATAATRVANDAKQQADQIAATLNGPAGTIATHTDQIAELQRQIQDLKQSPKGIASFGPPIKHGFFFAWKVARGTSGFVYSCGKHVLSKGNEKRKEMQDKITQTERWKKSKQFASSVWTYANHRKDDAQALASQKWQDAKSDPNLRYKLAAGGAATLLGVTYLARSYFAASEETNQL